MPVGHLSIRIDSTRRDHHLWLNNGTWWCHYTLHFDGRKRRIRRSLRTRDLERAIALRDELFAQIREHGQVVPPRRKDADGLQGFLPLQIPPSGSITSPPWLVGA
ncbi:MAG: hypothetical protein ACKOHK_09085 [Planctomycetia bacterium]